MPRRLRFVPKPATLMEVTCRIIHGRMLLKPSQQLNQMIAGTLASAKRRYGVRICAVAYLSNHAHLLLEVDDAQQLARFMGLVNSKIAREVAKLTGWSEKIWGERYSASVVSDEAESQIARLRYVLSQGVKEHLVARCRDWPGVHAAKALATGGTIKGYWFDRTAVHSARLRGQKSDGYTFAKLEPLEFDPLPCWAGLSKADQQECVGELIVGIEADAKAERCRRGIVPLGARAIRRQDPKQRYREPECRPAPAFHAISLSARQQLREGYRWFVSAYREAAQRLRAGEFQVLFPRGCFPPPLPFVRLVTT